MIKHSSSGLAHEPSDFDYREAKTSNLVQEVKEELESLRSENKCLKRDKEQYKQSLSDIENKNEALIKDNEHFLNEIHVLREKLAHKNGQEVEPHQEPANAAEAVKRLLNGEDVTISDEELWKKVWEAAVILRIELDVKTQWICKVKEVSGDE